MRNSPLKDIIESKDYPTDIILVILLTVIGTISAFALPDNNIFRIIFGIPIVLFFPGYVIVSIMWPGNASHYDDDSRAILLQERIAYGFGLSLLLSALTGIALNFIWEISLFSLIVSITSFIILFGCLAWFRRVLLPEEERFFIQIGMGNKLEDIDSHEKFMVAIIAASLIVSVIVIGYSLTHPPSEESYTEFYMLDQNRTINNLPKNISVNETARLIIGVVSHEYEHTNYTVVVSQTNDTGHIQNQTMDSYNISLEHEGQDERELSFSMEVPGQYRVVFELYLPGEAEPYREIHLWVVVN